MVTDTAPSTNRKQSDALGKLNVSTTLPDVYRTDMIRLRSRCAVAASTAEALTLFLTLRY